MGLRVQRVWSGLQGLGEMGTLFKALGFSSEGFFNLGSALNPRPLNSPNQAGRLLARS